VSDPSTPLIIGDAYSTCTQVVHSSVTSALKFRLDAGSGPGKIEGSPTISQVKRPEASADVSASQVAACTATSGVGPKPPPVKASRFASQ
jgi:hypothetical protein